jgi:hypothetical protein
VTCLPHYANPPLLFIITDEFMPGNEETCGLANNNFSIKMYFNSPRRRGRLDYLLLFSIAFGSASQNAASSFLFPFGVLGPNIIFNALMNIIFTVELCKFGTPTLPFCLLSLNFQFVRIYGETLT